MAQKNNEELLAEWKREKGGFGRLRLLKSGNFQASFKGLDGAIHKAPKTFRFRYDLAKNAYAKADRIKDAEERDKALKAAKNAGAQDAEEWLERQREIIEYSLRHNQPWVSPERKGVQNTLTVEALIKDWLANSPKITKDSTRQKHMQYMNLRVLCDSRPGFDSLKDELATNIDRNRIKRWWKQINEVWKDTGSTNAFAYKRLHTAFNHAVKRLEIITTNPVDIEGAGAVPESENKKRALIQPEEARGLVEHITPRLKAPVAVLLWCGLRIGELLELRRSDMAVINDTVTIHVARNAQPLYDNETGKYTMRTLDSPKTPDGDRTVVVPKFATAWVIEHLAEYVEKKPDSFFVTTTTGRRMFPSHFRKFFAEAAKAAGRPDISPHDCRRYFGTMLVRTELPLDEGRRLMGHKTIEQMMEYQRADRDYQTAAAQALDRLLSGSGNDTKNSK